MLKSEAIKIIKEMDERKRAFLMLRIYGDSWKVNMGKVFKGINADKQAMIKKGLKEIKVLNKKKDDSLEKFFALYKSRGCWVWTRLEINNNVKKGFTDRLATKPSKINNVDVDDIKFMIDPISTIGKYRNNN